MEVGTLTVICAWCKATLYTYAIAGKDATSHGICSGCEAKIMAAIELVADNG